jgi:hypothetical protein
MKTEFITNITNIMYNASDPVWWHVKTTRLSQIAKETISILSTLHTFYLN